LTTATPLLLASGSPRRRDILGALGIPLVALASDVPEVRSAHETVEGFLSRVVDDKLQASVAAARELQFSAALAADTIVQVDAEVLGKPIDIRDAERLLGKLVGRSHQVKTHYAIVTPDGRRSARCVSTEVTFRHATVDELRRYAQTGEGLDKAGAYAAQGIGAFLVRAVTGSYTNVVGLPACEVIEDLIGLGLLPGFPSEPGPNSPSF
jgi:septum formation protein